jgi:hypothetical protein
MKCRLPLALFSFFVLSLSSLTVPAFAHHGFQYEYDGTKAVDTTGILTKVDWENPHIYFNVDVKDAEGKVSTWRFEGSSVSLVQRTGTKRGDLVGNIGKTITVTSCPGKGGALKGAAWKVSLADGREVSIGRNRYYGDGPKPPDDKDEN